MNNTFKLSSVFAASLLASTCALAEQAPKWDFIQASYTTIEIDEADWIDLSGFGISGSKLINENLFIAASYNNVSDSFHGFKVDITNLSAGIGYRHGLTATTDFYGIASIIAQDVDTYYDGEGDDGDDDTGYMLTAGVRSMLTDNFELSGSVAYGDIFDESDTSFALNAFYHFNANLSVGASYAIADDTDTLGASVRYSF